MIVLGGHLRELAGLLQPGSRLLRRRVLSAAWDAPGSRPRLRTGPGALGGALLELERLVDDPPPGSPAEPGRGVPLAGQKGFTDRTGRTKITSCARRCRTSH